MKILMDESEYQLYVTYLEGGINPLTAILQMTCTMEPELLIIPNESETETKP